MVEKKAKKKPAPKKKSATNLQAVRSKAVKKEAKAPKKKLTKKKPPKKELSKKKTPDLMPVINIGTVGHVDHGKTTLVKALSGKWTDTHSEEIRRGITIRLGYADATFYKCKKCRAPECYTVFKQCPKCKGATEPLRTVSFIDAPGHESLMATMLSGATIMDGALLLVAANEPCPQPQTREHIMALHIAGMKNVVVVQNKIDLVTKEEALENHKQIKELLKDTEYKDAPIIPISAQHQLNIDILIKAIEETIPTPERDLLKDPLMFVARSFDINHPGSDPLKIQGGVLGGAMAQGVLKKGDTIEIRPGRKVESEGKVEWHPLTTTILSLMKGGKSVKDVGPGGSIGARTLLDPSIVKADNLGGSVAGHPGKLPPIRQALKLRTTMLQRVVGSKDELEVKPITQGEPLMLNVNTSSTIGVATELHKDIIICKLKLAICAEDGARVTISRRIADRFRLIGYGIIEG